MPASYRQRIEGRRAAGFRRLLEHLTPIADLPGAQPARRPQPIRAAIADILERTAAWLRR